MSRPQKSRYVCQLPQYSVFGPKGVKSNRLERITLLVDELETVRLIDHLGYTQEEAAEQMNVARTTVQRIYNDARKKIASSLIDGKIIVIEGGEFTLCEDNNGRCLRPSRLRKGHGNQ
ncbi:MAG: DUF134 domain-containing protein [Candidatus Izemoplasmatales bacterium]